jgi:hypothetical protein
MRVFEIEIIRQHNSGSKGVDVQELSTLTTTPERQQMHPNCSFQWHIMAEGRQAPYYSLHHLKITSLSSLGILKTEENLH